MTPHDLRDIVATARLNGAKMPDAPEATIIAAWHKTLGGYPKADVEAATRRALTANPFLDAGQIVAHVKAIRADRIDRFGPRPAPNCDPDDATAYAIEAKAMRDAIADGAFRREHVEDYVASGRSIAAKRDGIAIASPPATTTTPAEIEAGKAIGKRLGIEAVA